MAYRVGKDEFERLVATALADVPEPFARILEEVAVEVRDRPSPGQLKRTRMRRGDLLLGLYQGRPITERSVMDSGTMPDVIYVFQDSIEQVCRNEQELIEQVRTTVLHEIGHHFGLDEEDLDELGYG